MRKLATVRKISEIVQIPNAERIELAIVDGWQAVVGRGDFKPGEKIIFCEIDSFLPVQPEFEFLRRSSYVRMADGSEGFRIKTMLMRGQLSQGLVLKLHSDNWEIGEDVTELMNITLYDATLGKNLGKDIKAGFPGFIHKTGCERIQNLTAVFPELRYKRWNATEKVDGESCTIYWRDDQFGVCSREWEVNELSPLYQMAVKLGLHKLHSCPNIAIQGEYVDPARKKNLYNLEEPQFFAFNIFDIDSGRYFGRPYMSRLCDDMGVQTVPCLTYDTFLPSTLEEVLAFARGKSLLNPSAEREGVVFSSNRQPRISFKAISNHYLLIEPD